jgi:hypothetical protein
MASARKMIGVFCATRTCTVHKDVCKDDDDPYDITIGCDKSFDVDSIKSEERNEELGLPGITFPMSRALLTKPNVFIADTGSTVHSTRFKSSFKNARKERTTILSPWTIAPGRVLP